MRTLDCILQWILNNTTYSEVTADSWQGKKYSDGTFDISKSAMFSPGSSTRTTTITLPFAAKNTGYIITASIANNGSVVSNFWIGDANANETRTATTFKCSCTTTLTDFYIVFTVHVVGRWR